MKVKQAMRLVCSFYSIGGISLVAKGIFTKLRSTLNLYVDEGEWMEVRFNGRVYRVSTEYPEVERWHKYSLGVAEPGAKRIITRVLDEGDCFFDIGAQCGDTLFYAHSIVGDQGTIHAFEPTTYWYDILCKNLHKNDINNVTANNVAAGEEAGKLPPKAIVGGRHELMDETFEQPVVDVVSIEEYISRTEASPDLIQIDVDGADLDVLKGMESLLGTIPVILELHHQDILEKWDKTVTFILERATVMYLEEQGENANLHSFGTEITSKEQLSRDTVSYLLLN